MENGTTDDSEYVIKTISGDINSFDILVKKYIPKVYSFIFHIVRNTEEANDITQETFLKAFQKIKQYNTNSSFKNWLITISHNTAIDYIRKKKTIPFSLLDDKDSDIQFKDTLEDLEPLPDRLFENEEMKQSLERALQTLSIEERSIIVLHNYQELTFNEIATVLKKSLNTVKSTYRRSLHKMRNHFDAPPY